MATALILLGSNLGDRQGTLDAAVARLQGAAGIEQVAVSSYHATTAIGGPAGQAAFLNAAARLETSLSPRQLFTELQRIEHELGRQRQEHWGPRTLDLDLLLYDDLVINEPDLIVPHRFLPFRRFVLEPAGEVASELVHPSLHWTVGRMLTHVNSARHQFAVMGEDHASVSEVARRLAAAGVELVDTDPKAVLQLGSSAMPGVPTLLLPADDLDRAFREAVAAIAAMQ